MAGSFHHAMYIKRGALCCAPFFFCFNRGRPAGRLPFVCYNRGEFAGWRTPFLRGLYYEGFRRRPEAFLLCACFVKVRQAVWYSGASGCLILWCARLLILRWGALASSQVRCSDEKDVKMTHTIEELRNAPVTVGLASHISDYSYLPAASVSVISYKDDALRYRTACPLYLCMSALARQPRRQERFRVKMTHFYTHKCALQSLFVQFVQNIRRKVRLFYGFLC